MPEGQSIPPDQFQRERTLDSKRSVLVRAPAGSGKTNLLTRRFLLLLGEVDDPGEIVAITFTRAAAAEMRSRILAELEKAASADHPETGLHQPEPAIDAFSMERLAQRALDRSRALGWNLIDLPAQLRISTIDSFCRELALQEPILSGLGGRLEIHQQPKELYGRAARRTLERIGKSDPDLNAAIETLLLWRDNHWADLENQIVAMLARRDQWMHEDFLHRDPDWDLLREQLERPFARAIRMVLTGLELLFEQIPGAMAEAHALARFACEQSGGTLHRDLAQLADFPAGPFTDADQLEEARRAYCCIAELLLTKDGFRQRVDRRHGFPAEAKQEKMRLAALIDLLSREPAVPEALAAVRCLPPAHYSDEDWEIVRACFIVLRHAAGQLRVAFAETGSADFVEVAQIAQRALRGEDGLPNDTAQAFADGIHHLLIDEFQDTSRRQHRLIAHLVAAWSGREDRTCFVVGDPMQSIYFFRDADAELFLRAEQLGLEVPGDLPLVFDPVQLFANFRSTPSLIRRLNRAFSDIFAQDDGSGIDFTPAEPAREEEAQSGLQPIESLPAPLQLHLEIMPVSGGASFQERDARKRQRESAREKQMEEIVALIRSRLDRMKAADAAGEKYRIAILGRARNALTPVAEALHRAGISFRAKELEALQDRPEIVDALALVRALFNPEDRAAWLGVLRAPWCALSLADLHALTSADDEELKSRPIPDLLAERTNLLGDHGRIAVSRALDAIAFAGRFESAQPTTSLGSRMEQVWLRMGGAQCVDATARANLDLFWRCLDNLPQGEPDLLGAALDTALADLRALPDPESSINCGVQLMTIHGAKGLEFEVVIVPEIQAGPGGSKFEMLSWMERGLPPGASDANEEEITEFLVAPFPAKGAERGSTKAWVDQVRREREQQEARRVFYVAATRAREELHLFARLEFKSAADGSLQLAPMRESLLKTAWPALREQIERRFEEWKFSISAHEEDGQTIESIAASMENEIALSAPGNGSQPKPVRLRRLPSAFRSLPEEIQSDMENPIVGAGSLYERHEGGPISRALGNAVHELFQRFAELRIAQAHESARMSIAVFAERVTAKLRASGIEVAAAHRIAEQALAIVLEAAADPQAQWILAPHADAANETRWTGIVSGSVRTVQVDRVFRAGPRPHSEGSNTWWIVDYKTADGDGRDPATELPELRRIFAPQIESYAGVLRNLHGSGTTICGGLYYPRMKLLDWWQL